MKADATLRHVPVIVISALDEIKSAARSIEMGAEDYLFKPFDPVLLRARINSSLDKQRLRNELVVREKLSSLGALTAGVAHELKNPLNFVLNFAELSAELASELRAKLDRPDLAEMAADLEQNVLKIKEHGARADSVIRSMLLHSRGSGGEHRPTDINRMVAEYVNLAYHGMRAENPTLQVRIEADYDPEVGSVDAVPQDISRVFLNLATNAFYAMRDRPGATLRVSTRDLGDRVEVRLRDNGPGIAHEIQARIFDPFFTTKPAGEGTGLGLSLSHDIVTAEHKGEIRVESEPGEGAEFIVTLPRKVSP
jgi:signal transduction histidine kinase